MDVDPDGFVEQVGDKLGVMSAQTKADMERFKDFIETRRAPTGGWRGKVEHND